METIEQNIERRLKQSEIDEQQFIAEALRRRRLSEADSKLYGPIRWVEYETGKTLASRFWKWLCGE